MAKKAKKAKRQLTSEEKIIRYKRRKRVMLFVKIAAVILAVAVMIPAAYYGYYYAVFEEMLMPTDDNDFYKARGYGYTRPLMAIGDSTWQFTLAYNYNDEWHVVDDDALLRENREKFIVYTKSDVTTPKNLKRLCMFKDNQRTVCNSLESLTLIDNRCFEGKEKIMTTEEFFAYAEQRHLYMDDYR